MDLLGLLGLLLAYTLNPHTSNAVRPFSPGSTTIIAPRAAQGSYHGPWYCMDELQPAAPPRRLPAAPARVPMGPVYP